MVEQKADVVRTDALKLIEQLGDGRVLYDLNKAVQDVVAGVRDYPQKAGSVTLKIVVTPMHKGEGERCVVSGHVTNKAPRKPAVDKVYFSTRENTLVRDDPRQKEFEADGFGRKE